MTVPMTWSVQPVSLNLLPIRITWHLLGLNTKSSSVISEQQMSIINCRLWRDPDINSKSSAYITQPTCGVGISCHPPLISDKHTHKTLSLTVLTTLFFPSRQTPSTDPGLHRGLNTTTVLYQLFSSTRTRSSQQPTRRSFGQPSHKLCWLLPLHPLS